MSEHKLRYRLEVMFTEVPTFASYSCSAYRRSAACQIKTTKSSPTDSPSIEACRSLAPPSKRLFLAMSPARKHSRDDRASQRQCAGAPRCVFQRYGSSLREPCSSQRRSSARRKSCNRTGCVQAANVKAIVADILFRRHHIHLQFKLREKFSLRRVRQ